MQELEPGIYVETKPINIAGYETPFGHAYLVYRKPDGSAEVIRGGPESLRNVGLGTKIAIEAGIPLQESSDRYGEGDTPQTRRATKIDIGDSDPEIIWRQMRAAARQIAEGEIDYNVIGWQNSNSTIRHVMEAAGLDPNKAAPDGADLFDHPGLRNDLNDAIHGAGKRPGQWDARQATPPDDGSRGWEEIPAHRPDRPSAVPASPPAEERSLAQVDGEARSAPAADGLGERVREFLKGLPALQKTLLKNPAAWTDGERRAVMGDVAYLNPAHPDHQRAHDGTAGFYAAIYGTGPSKTDASGKTIEPAPKRPVRPEPAPITTVEGEDLERAADNLADALDAAGRTQGPTEAVRRLQKGVNRLVDRDAPAPTPPRDPARFYAEAAERAAPRPARLKEDGIFGPKTADATAKALVRFGRRPVEAPLLAEESQQAAPTRRKPEADRPVFRA